MRLIPFVLVPFLLIDSATSAVAQTSYLTPPVDAGVASAFDVPLHPYGAGHRGIDYVVPGGSTVRSAGAGTVAFAGNVPRGAAVTIDHGAGLKTTYSRMSEVWVQEGDEVEEGTWIGRTESAHGPEVPGLHFAVKVDGAYVDPLLHLGPLDTGGAIALAPLSLDRFEESHVRTCKTSGELPAAPPAPNDNVVVAIGGITSSTAGTSDGPDIFRSLSTLGYSPAKVYRFSYRGADGPLFHERYDSWDTFGDLRVAASRLKDLMKKIARVHPGATVDLVAHSQGGIVARTYLTEQAQAWNAKLPRVEHLVTFASPHQGVPGAAEVEEFQKGQVSGQLVPPVLDAFSDYTGLAPSPDSPPLQQLRVGSELLRSLDRQDVMFGTKVLALAMPNDIIVPAPRALIPGKPGVTVPIDGVFGHSAIVQSSQALQAAHAFLGGAGAVCQPELGPIESRLGSWIDRGQGFIGDGLNLVIDSVVPF